VTIVQPEPNDLARGDLKFWFYQGVVLNVDNHNRLSIGDLAEFVSYVAKHFPDSKVEVSEYAIRATKMEGLAGPHLDWRD